VEDDDFARIAYDDMILALFFVILFKLNQDVRLKKKRQDCRRWKCICEDKGMYSPRL